ncbi:polysaccharide biosynthesis tyrosine autokinase [Phormidium sp. CLA17]|uniref:GumC family protein n=1 Tax=Leptolyngbya sp. Cla-17 TaxID=2803751 RepID=UPI001490A3F3|nr:polysaccharide biosynthesis tyrosine autokinase [Leptolyngbya sp. Cla-17]MBM0744642.1 polysaccharide biosynthesis tyrosine autokinase [Leptolyngbya sp. Cla-17]
MENHQNSQPLPPENHTARQFQWLPPINPARSGDEDEGGLNLGQVFSALKRGLPVIIGVTIVVTSAAMLKALSSKPIYQAGFEILTKPVTVESQVISSVPQTLGNKERETTSERTVTVDATKLKLLKSPKVLSPIADQLKSKYPTISEEEIATNLSVIPVPSSEILAVTLQDSDSEKVKAVLKLVAASYLNYSLEERLADVRQGIDFVNAQIPQLQQRVDAVQDRLQSFRQQYNLIDPDSTAERLSDQTNTVSQQGLETRIKLNEARALYNDLQELLRRADDPASIALSGNARYQALLSQLLTVEGEIAKESSLFKDNTPNVQVLKEQQQNLVPLLQREGRRVQEEVASQIRALEYRDRILGQAANQLNQQVKQLSVVSRQYTDIQQELKIATDNLNQFLTKREALRIDAGQRKAPWQILTPPGEPVPSAANVKRTTMLGVILGVLLGIGVALLLDKLSSVLHDPEEIKEISKFPVLGVIPHSRELEDIEELGSLGKLVSLGDIGGLMQQMGQKIKLNNGAKSRYYTASPFSEAFRSLYTNIRLLSSDTQVRSIVITSSTPGEGKSTISVHLAQAAAALGQRVLLVDTDLRRPKVHEQMGLINTSGLSNAISSDLEVERLIQQSPGERNLFILTAGQIPPDPTKLLSSQKMQNLMGQFKSAYDLVIYDTPPLVGLADTKLIASKTDGIVMVVRLSKTKRSVLSQALEGIKVFSVPVLGMVINGSREQTSLTDPYYHYQPMELESPSVVEKSTSSVFKQLDQ